MSDSKVTFPDRRNAPKKTDQKEFGLWANEYAVTSTILLFVGSIIGVAGTFQNWQFAASLIPASLLVFLMEWPRGNRQNGKTTVTRRGQDRLMPVIRSIKPLKNYYIRALLFLIVCIPSCFMLPTVIGGICLFISGIIYLAAAINGEEWKTASQANKDDLMDALSSPPQCPPPRILSNNSMHC